MKIRLFLITLGSAVLAGCCHRGGPPSRPEKTPDGGSMPATPTSASRPTAVSTASKPAVTAPPAPVELTFDSLPMDYNPAEPFHPDELTRLAAAPKENPRRLMWLINRAGAERDTRFRYLVNRRDLQEKPDLALSLAGYDYSVNGNRKSLDRLLSSLAAETPGSDSPTVLVMSFINEWKLTAPAVRKYFRVTDGAGSMSDAMFWTTRKHFFPRESRAFTGREAARSSAPPGSGGNSVSGTASRDRP